MPVDHNKLENGTSNAGHGTPNTGNGIENNVKQEKNGKNLGKINGAFLSDEGQQTIINSSKAEEAQRNVNNNNELDKQILPKTKDEQLWRDLVAFWFLGLCNNFGYVVMLSAAHDIIAKFDNKSISNINDVDNDRECHIMSTGAILLADILPALFVKLSAPFLPFWINVRVILAILLTTAGFLLVGFSEYQWMAILGVICTSLSSGLGETTFLAYSSRFNRNVISTWSSGTGGAGVGGSLSYAALREAKITPLVTMLIMLVVPLLECIAFWVVLRKPKKSTLLLQSNETIDQNEEDIRENSIESRSNDQETPLVTLKEKLLYILYLLRYMIPLTVVYLAEYFINQGLFELVYFENISMNKGNQYRWLNVVYQIGVMISRSTVNLYSVNKIWLFPIFQLINVIYFVNEVIFYITPSIWIVFAIVLWEGLLGGGAYVNTFYKMAKDIPIARRQFALGFVSISDSVGITLAGFLAMPVHNAICQIPVPNRL